MKNILLTPRIGTKPGHADGFGGSVKPTVPFAVPALTEGIFTMQRKKLSGCKVLVLDDNPINALLLERTLRRHTNKIDTTDSPSKALSMIGAAAKNGKYDLVLCDVMVGEGKTGFNVADEAANISPGTRFIFVSAGLISSYPVEMRVLPIPIDKNQLFERIGELFDPS